MPRHAPLELTDPKQPDTGRKRLRIAGSHHMMPSLSQALIGLSSLLLLGSTHAQSLTPAPTDGIYLSSERSTLLEGISASERSSTDLPDPALLLLQAATTSKTDLRRAAWFDDSAWITDIGISLYHDADRDGYHSSMSLSMDADTDTDYTEVYVTIDLQRLPGTRERLHTSDIFALYGRSLSDEYQIDFDLLQNYPAGFYNLYIELHDAYDQSILDNVGATDFSNLSRLPLESEDLDYQYDPAPYEPQYPPANDDIHVTEYAGSAGFLTTLCLTLALGARRRKRN